MPRHAFLFICVQTFILTFLGEWGDRSQIATIALGAAHVRAPCQISTQHTNLKDVQNVYIVTIGTIIGHALCTGVAVLGGRWLSTKISIKHGT
jgi:putative Ca2+/H+ antiporter (TMEM165/GDT1 family)